jgi:hypothetical protein
MFVSNVKRPHVISVYCSLHLRLQGRIQGGAHPARAPLKLETNMIFWRKIVIFHTKYPKYFRASLGNWKKYDFLA